MRDLDLIVLADRNCSTSRTYLTYLRAAGYRVRKLIVVDFHFGRAEEVLPPPPLTERVKSWIGRPPVPVIPDPEPPSADPQFKSFCQRLIPNMPIEIDYFTPFDFASHAATLEVMTAHDYDDPRLQDKVMAEAPAVFLYTNGGMVPRKLLDSPGVRFLHIHPGVVPDIRGGDGLYWSVLVRGRPGASCFYMSAGIDTGDVIATMEFENPGLSGFELEETQASEDLFYRALLYALDPHLRAQLLVHVVEMAPGDDLSALPTKAQPDGGRHYHWIHPRLRKRVAADMIKRDHQTLSARVTPV